MTDPNHPAPDTVEAIAYPTLREANDRLREALELFRPLMDHWVSDKHRRNIFEGAGGYDQLCRDTCDALNLSLADCDLVRAALLTTPPVMNPVYHARDFGARLGAAMNERAYTDSFIAAAREDGRRAGIEEAAAKATGFLVGDPENGIPLRNPMSHEIAEAIRSLSRAPSATSEGMDGWRPIAE